MPDSLTMLPILVKPFTPLIKKQAAVYAADYLNRRRQIRLLRQSGLINGDKLDPETLKALCGLAAEAGQNPRLILGSGVLGAVVGAALCYILVKRQYVSGDN